MEKLKRTFRLSEQAVEAIENRNRKLYPTATDFLEAKILAPADNSTEMLHKISAQLREMESLLVHHNPPKIFLFFFPAFPNLPLLFLIVLLNPFFTLLRFLF